MEESKYAPLTDSEFVELSLTLENITTHLPTNKTGYIWAMYNRVRDVKEPQPCNCGSAAGHWNRALDFLREWVKARV